MATKNFNSKGKAPGKASLVGAKNRNTDGYINMHRKDVVSQRDQDRATISVEPIAVEESNKAPKVRSSERGRKTQEPGIGQVSPGDRVAHYYTGGMQTQQRGQKNKQPPDLVSTINQAL